MSRALHREAVRKAMRARRLYEVALDHYAAGDEMVAEARRLVDEVDDLMEGRKPLPRPVEPVPAPKLH